MYISIAACPGLLLREVDVVVDVVHAVAVVAVALGAVAELHLGVAEVGLAAHGTLVKVLGLGLGLGVVEVDHLGPEPGRW
mgnify:CR=1 FL=1